MGVGCIMLPFYGTISTVYQFWWCGSWVYHASDPMVQSRLFTSFDDVGVGCIMLLILWYNLACLPVLMMLELGVSCFWSYGTISLVYQFWWCGSWVYHASEHAPQVPNLQGFEHEWHFQVQLMVMKEILCRSSASDTSCIVSDLPSLLLFSQSRVLAVLLMCLCMSYH